MSESCKTCQDHCVYKALGDQKALDHNKINMIISYHTHGKSTKHQHYSIKYKAPGGLQVDIFTE